MSKEQWIPTSLRARWHTIFDYLLVLVENQLRVVGCLTMNGRKITYSIIVY